MNLFRAISVFVALTASLSAFSSEKRVLGKLGQVTEATPIFSSMSSRAHVYYKVKQYEYLVISSAPRDNWMKVLLQNGAYGYVPADTVAKLPYEVTAEMPSATSSRGSIPSSRSRSAIANYGLNFIGTPYKWGGNDIEHGIDCSGFVKKLFGTVAGIDLPRTAAEQALVGQPITRLENLQPGDRLYFWENKRGKIGHTGIYLGNGYFVHSSRGHNGVATDYLGTQKWLRILVAARR